MTSTGPSWDEVAVGMTVGPHAVEISEALVREYCAAIGAPPEPYLSPSDGGAPYMPALLPAAWYIHLLKGRLNLGYGLMARHGMQSYGAVAIGDRLVATGLLTERYERKGRHYWTLEYEMRGADGGLRQTHRLTSTVD